MKTFIFLIGLGLVSSLVGCSSTPIVLARVGPNPDGLPSTSSTGTLQVFSRVADRSDDQNEGGDGLSDRYRYTAYSVYDLRGTPIKHVANASGHYAQTPQRIALPPGQYVVKARAKDYFWIKAPVTIEAGRTTIVHLDDKWKSAGDAPPAELVTLPNGKPVGWRAGP